MTIDDRGHVPPAQARRSVRVLVVDDHPIFRRGLVDVINDEPGMVVCGEAGTSAAAQAIVATEQPDVAVVDLALRDESGLDLVTAFSKSMPTLRVLMLSGHDEKLYAIRALQAGALGYIMKDQAANELLVAIRRVASGKPYVSSDTAERILSTLGVTPTAASEPLIDRLSNRERHVFTLVGRGLTTREIAMELELSVKTVESHYANLKKKLGARNSRELTRLAINWTEDGLRRS
jgi:DNA-binding NarL/FixJ family response regulator